MKSINKIGMRKFIITSEKFKGEAELWYGFDGLLCRFDLMSCEMDYKQVDYLRENIAVDVTLLAQCFNSKTLQIKEYPLVFTVEDFKKEYPYSRNMHLLPPRWAKMPQKDTVLAVFRAKDYADYCKRNAKWYKPMIADTWLSKREFINDWKKL